MFYAAPLPKRKLKISEDKQSVQGQSGFEPGLRDSRTSIPNIYYIPYMSIEFFKYIHIFSFGHQTTLKFRKKETHITASILYVKIRLA